MPMIAGLGSLAAVREAGGVQQLANLIANGASLGVIHESAAHMLGTGNLSQEYRLVDQATEIVEAGQLANARELQDVLTLNTIPVLPELFGDDPEGLRVRARVTITDAESGEQTVLMVDSPTRLTLGELEQQAAELLGTLAEAYPDRYAEFEPENITPADVHVDWIARKF